MYLPYKMLSELLDQGNYELVTELAALAMEVRGFEDIKLRSAERFFIRLEELTQAISSNHNQTVLAASRPMITAIALLRLQTI